MKFPFRVLFFSALLFYFGFQISFAAFHELPELISRIAQFTAGNPTHIEEIAFQDRKLLTLRLVCKQWERVATDFLYKRIDFVNVKQLFVVLPFDNVEFYYKKRINYLKKLRLAQRSEAFLRWINFQELDIEQDPDSQNKKITACNMFARNLHKYLENRGFVYSSAKYDICSFLFNELDPLMKNEQIQKPCLPEELRTFLYKHYQDRTLFDPSVFNMDYSDFLAQLVRKASYLVDKYGNNRPESDLLSMQVFKDLPGLSNRIDYQSFIQAICSLPLPLSDFRSNLCSRKAIRIFLKLWRNHFTQNNFEGSEFLYYLLQYRLQFHRSIIYYSKDLNLQRGPARWQQETVAALDRFIIEFTKEFDAELKRIPTSKKEAYQTLFNSTQILTPGQAGDDFTRWRNSSKKWHSRYLKKQQAIELKFDWLFLSWPDWIRKEKFFIAKTVLACVVLLWIARTLMIKTAQMPPGLIAFA